MKVKSIIYYKWKHHLEDLEEKVEEQVEEEQVEEELVEEIL